MGGSMSNSSELVPVATLEFEGVPVELYEGRGDIWAEGAAIGKALGYSNPGTAIRKLYARYEDEMELLTYQSGTGRQTRFFNRRGAYLLGMFARTKRAKEYRRWVVEVLDRFAQGAFVPRAEYDRVLRRLAMIELANLRARYGVEGGRWGKFLKYRAAGVSRRDLARVFRISHRTVGILLRAAAEAGLVELQEQPEALRRQAERLKLGAARQLSGAVVR